MRQWLWLVGALSIVGCGSRLPSNGAKDGSGTVEIRLGASDAWPSGVQSARIRMTRTGGATGCGAAVDVLNVCICRNAGAGCDFAGSPTPTSAVTNLCSGDWTLDTATTAAYTATACPPAAALTTTEAMSPSPLDVPYASTATAQVTFTASSGINADVDFTGR